MRAVVQRVREASVTVEGKIHGCIGNGLLVYVGVDRDDSDADVAYLANKLANLRIFPDERDRLNLSISQTPGRVLAISAFTVQGDARRGRRPSFESAASSDRALVIYELFCDVLRQAGVDVVRGSFGSNMDVHSINAGPVCILLESRRIF